MRQAMVLAIKVTLFKIFYHHYTISNQWCSSLQGTNISDTRLQFPTSDVFPFLNIGISIKDAVFVLFWYSHICNVYSNTILKAYLIRTNVYLNSACTIRIVLDILYSHTRIFICIFRRHIDWFPIQRQSTNYSGFLSSITFIWFTHIN